MKRLSHWAILTDQSGVTEDVASYQYRGSGTPEDPFQVEWIPNDPRDPTLFPKWKMWLLTVSVSLSTFGIAFASTGFSGGQTQIVEEFGISDEVATLGLSLFVIGFAIGPLLWAPLSEVFGRQALFVTTYGALTAFNAGVCASPNVEALLILRFLAGAFGSSPLSNAGGVIADMFPASERGLAMCIFAAAPFLGPVIGPIVGGFAGQSIGWRWNCGIITIFTGVIWIFCTLVVPETYAVVLLEKRAAKLSKMTGKCYKSKLEIEKGKDSVATKYKKALTRPWVFLLKEPIVLFLSLYMAIVYGGALYLTIPAFPIIYQEARGWSEGISGLTFIGMAVGMCFGIVLAIYDNARFKRVLAKNNGVAPPEERLVPTMYGAIAIPVGLFIFAWTNGPEIHWIVSIIFTSGFGFGNVVLFLSVSNYLVDSYTIYAASVLAASTVIRSIIGGVFPLFTSVMYRNLGIHWGSSVPAFLTLACVPLPFLLYKFGPAIRKRCKYAAEAAELAAKLRTKREQPSEDVEKSGSDASDKIDN